MVKKRLQQKNFWCDKAFVEEIRQMKHLKSINDHKDYSDADITEILAKHPDFQELKSKIVNDNRQVTATIKIKMDRKRGGFL